MLEGSDEVRDIKSPKQGAEAAALGQTFQDSDVLMLGDVAVQHANAVSVV